MQLGLGERGSATSVEEGQKRGVVVLRGVAQFPLNLTWRIVA